MDAGLAQTVLDLARQHGAVAAEVVVTTRHGTSLTAVRGRPVTAPATSSVTQHLRVWADNGGSAAAFVDPDDIPGLLARASVSPTRRGPVERPVPPLASTIHDPRRSALTLEDRTEALVDAERSVRLVDRKLEPRAFRYTEELRARRYANTAGVVLRESDTTFGCEGTVASGSVARTSSMAARSFSTIAGLPLGVGLARRVVELVAAPSTVRGPVSVVLPANAAATLIDGLVRAILRGGAAFLDGARLDPRLHVIDDGVLPGGLRTASFDDGGRRPRPLVVLRGGRLGDAYDPETSGREWDGAVRSGNLSLRPGTQPLHLVLPSIGPALRLDEWEPVQVDERGAVTMRAWGSTWDAGRRTGSVHGIPLYGNLGEALASIGEVCDDVERVGHVDAVPLILHGFWLGERAAVSEPGRRRSSPPAAATPSAAPPR